MIVKIFPILSVIFVYIFSCTPMQIIETPDSKNSLNSQQLLDYRIISPGRNTCKPLKEFKRWKILFATYPIYTPAPEEMFPSITKSYRIIETSDWKDVTISILLGLTTTVTRDTLVVEECTPSEKFLADIASRIPENSPLFQEKLAEAIQEEKIRLKISDLEVFEKEVDDASSNSGEVGQTKVWLKSGRFLKGKLLNQDIEKVLLIDEKGLEKEIMKSDIQKIQFR